MRIGIFGPRADPLVAHLGDHLQSRGVEVWNLDLGQVSQGIPVAWDGDDWLVEGNALSECAAFFVRKVPGETALLDDPSAERSAAAWFRGSMLARERAHFAQSCLLDLERAGRRVVNPPSRCAQSEPKPSQLSLLARAGIPVPRTLVTNFPPAVLAFRKDVGDVIFKPTAGGAEAEVLADDALSRIEEIAPSPVIFQQRLFGPDIRVTVVAGRVVSAVEIPTDGVDYRSSGKYQAGKQEYLPLTLSPEVVSLCVRTAEVCGHVLSGVDLKRLPDGRHVVLEANSSPTYLDIELKTGHPITRAVADVLMGLERA